MGKQHDLFCCSAPSKYAFLSVGATPMLLLNIFAAWAKKAIRKLLVLFVIICQTKSKTPKNDTSGHNGSVVSLARPRELNHMIAGPTRHQCQRFATMKISTSAGLGHNIGEVIFGILFAFEAEAMYVFDEEGFLLNGRHGNYSWVHSILDLSKLQSRRTISKLDDMKSISLKSWDDLTLYSHECQVFLHTSWKSCTDFISPFRMGVSCFSHKIGAFNMAKSYLRRLLKADALTPRTTSYLRNTSMVSVVWHVRVGDRFVFRSVDFYRKVHTLIEDLFPAGHVNYFLSEGYCEKVRKLLPFLAVPLCTLNSEDTFRHFLAADVFVTSGSSFASAAALLRTNPIVLQTLPKEGHFGVFEVTDHAIVNSNGDLHHPSLLVLKRQAANISKGKA